MLLHYIDWDQISFVHEWKISYQAPQICRPIQDKRSCVGNISSALMYLTLKKQVLASEPLPNKPIVCLVSLYSGIWELKMIYLIIYITEKH